ncbi:hypothetical protein BTUL_0170g00060 [Botrytis tulipae]|uniref:Uncharacterized protein n=1 Tax=Botrytis tulipae TaxID=87230 RepID=A0A4Z1EAR8_9HELO|nr:hypothetical protein BTUL_0170g00060 [Botrytis tulipae]
MFYSQKSQGSEKCLESAGKVYFSFNVKPTPLPELQCSGSCDCLIGIETANGENWGLGGDDDEVDEDDDK